MPSTLRITRRPATENDLPFLLQLRHETMDAHIAAAGLVLSEDENRERVRHRLDCAEIILLHDESVGMLKVSRDTQPWKILQLQISSSAQGMGMGGEILAVLIKEAQAAGAELALSVLKANHARNLYERAGFVVVAETDLEFEMAWRE